MPRVQKKCKIVSYIKKYLLSHIRAPFLVDRKMTCSHIFVLGLVCVLLQTVFITFQSKAECCLECLSLSAAKYIGRFTYCMMIKMYR